MKCKCARLLSVASPALLYFSTLSYKWRDLLKKKRFTKQSGKSKQIDIVIWFSVSKFYSGDWQKHEL